LDQRERRMQGDGENCIMSFINGSLWRHNYKDNVMDDKLGRACSTNGGKRNPYRILGGKSVGRRPLGRPRHRWVDNIKIDVR
jgi:hypothetical protein